MTYIVGFRQPGINAIIGDARVTRTSPDQRSSENTVVKTGFLFPGCIFGRVGSEFHSAGFIRAFRRVIHEKRDTLQGLWQRFEHFVDNYPFTGRQGEHFQLLLSTRASGEPCFYVLDAQNGLQRVDDQRDYYVVTYGSGRDILDPKVKGSFGVWLRLIQEHLLGQMQLSERSAFATTPHCLCLLLSEMSLTYERGALEERGVGGAFHFIYPDTETDHRQEPALYILCALGSSRTIYPFLFRVVCIPGGLYVREQVPPGQYIAAPDGEKVQTLEYALLDSLARPDIILDDEGRLLMPEELEEIQRQILQEVDSVPFYQFCGFGFMDSQYRSSFRFMLSENGKLEDIFGEDGKLARVHQSYLERAFSLGKSQEFLHR